MSGFRAYFDFTKDNADGLISLSADESRHLCGSLRARKGDAVDAFDLSGNIYSCTIEHPDTKSALLKIIQRVRPAKRQTQIWLLQCLPKGKTFDEIIRQCVELGAAGVIPILSRFSQVKIPPQELEKKRQKWLAQVIEAVKQSSNFDGFELPGAQTFEQALTETSDFDLKIAASLEPDAKNISSVFKGLKRTPKKVAVLIGPEGDMSADEYSLARNYGFAPVTLGKNVLKSNTAAVSTLSQVIAALDFIS